MEEREMVNKIFQLLVKIFRAPYRYRVEVDQRYKGADCKVVVYERKTGNVYLALRRETYELIKELVEKATGGLRYDAEVVLSYIEKLIDEELWEIELVKSLMYRAKHLVKSSEIKDGKIIVHIEGMTFELPEEKVEELAKVDADIRRYYEEFLEKIWMSERRKKLDLLWDEIKDNWVRLVLLGKMLNLVGISRGEGRSGLYYSLRIDLLPREVRERIKDYLIYLKDTRGIRDIDSVAFPGLTKPSRVAPGWYVPEKHKETVEKILREMANKYATEEDIKIVNEYKKLGGR
jgi:hypothetical protein